jgi:TonB-linked SusC/RagA family outer membrane protein
MELNAFNLGMPYKWLPPKLLLIMKLIIIIMTTFLMQVHASTFGQLVTLKEKNLSLEDAFKMIRNQTGYDFIYDATLLKDTHPIAIDVKDFSLEESLTQCLFNQNLTFEIKDMSVTIKRKSILNNLADYLNAIDIRGKVFDEKGNPLIGAVIRIKGSNRQTATNSRAEFVFQNVDEKSTLTISYVGYKTQEVRLKPNQTVLSIIMEVAENKMDEVVISTGIFKKADKSFTGSSITVTAKELQEFGNRNLIVSLRNIDPAFNIIESNTMGSDPNRLPDIQIRGNSSLPNVDNLDNLAGLNTPLIILNGFQSTLQRMLDINVNEVESITILKDASATAIYGSRGSNGVVVITTILPKPGALRISYRADVNLEVADLSDYHLLDARQKLELEKNVGLYNNTTIENDLRLKRYYNYILNDINSGVNTDWLGIPLRTGVGQRHNFSISGGDYTFRYAASAQVNNIQGVMKGSERNTFNGNINLAYTYRNVKFSNQLMITEGRSAESSYGSFSDYVKMNPYWKAFDNNGKVLKILGDPGNTDYQLRWSSLPTSPLYNATLNVFDKTKTSQLVNNSSIEWTMLKGLQVRAQLGLTKEIQQKDKFRPADHTAFATYTSADLFRKGDYNYGISNGFSYDGSLNLQYSTTIHEKHTLFAGLDYNIRQDQNSGYTFLAEGFTNPNFDFISMALQYGKDQKPGGTESLTRAMGLTANVNYIYDDRFFADASLRMDGSSQFGRNNQVAPFWSVGAGWNLHNEAFLKDNKVIERLKLRGSAGITGSQNFSAYQALSTYRYYTDNRYFNWNGAYLLGIGNEDLRWQQALKYDIGFDAEFIKGRLRLTGDYYTSTTRDLLSSIDLPASNGFPSYVENVGKMGNKGFELRGTGIFINRPSNRLFWSVTAGIVQNRNKILKTSQALKVAQQSRQMTAGAAPTSLYFEGYSTNTIWVVPSLGIDPSNGKEVYMDINGKPTYIWSGNDLRAMGNSEPDFMGNFSTMIRYKTVSLNASFGYRFGGQMYNQTLIDKVENVDFKYNVDLRVYTDRWQQPGDQVGFKGLMVTSVTNKSSRFVQDERTITCQNINLQYDLRSAYLKRNLRLSNLSVTANVADPFRFSTIKQERGTVYPFSRQFSLSISATF